MRHLLKPDPLPRQLDLFTADAALALPSHPGSETENRFPAAPFSPDTKKRLIELNGISIAYQFRRSKRRSIGFLVNENGLRVTAPRRIPIKTVEEAIREKERWITSKLDYFRTRHKQPAPPMLENGASLPYLGSHIRLCLRQGQPDNILLQAGHQELVITAMQPLTPAVAADRLKTWFQEQAREIFARRLPVFAARLGVSYRAFSLSSARSRWGSCSISGHIRLNWRLVHFSPDLIDYVIIHELAHLHEMNHSKHFWNWVAQACPDYKAARSRLRQANRLIQLPF